MAVTSYYSIDGEILGERTDGGARNNYGVDALGSVTSTMVGDAVVNRYSYKPYGSLLSKSGAGADPAFQWVGTQGYRLTGRAYSESYVRARHYDQISGRWTSVDLLWPGEPQYGYAANRPTTLADLSDQQPCGPKTTKAVLQLICAGPPAGLGIGQLASKVCAACCGCECRGLQHVFASEIQIKVMFLGSRPRPCYVYGAKDCGTEKVSLSRGCGSGFVCDKPRSEPSCSDAAEVTYTGLFTDVYQKYRLSGHAKWTMSVYMRAVNVCYKDPRVA